MIMINLLPHRDERRKRRKVAYYAGLGVAALVAAVSGQTGMIAHSLVFTSSSHEQALTHFQ